ncbi:MAG: hypothetical protein ABIT20_06680 [Gemmatimonadaceae bacterium]
MKVPDRRPTFVRHGAVRISPALIVNRSEASIMTVRHVRPVLSMIGLLIVEMIIGYEWLISGLVKVVQGDFPSGLGATLLERLPKVPAWYGRFLSGAVIPNAPYFGYAIEIAEVLAGVALLAGPVIALFAWERVPHWMRQAVLFVTAVATIGGAFLAINLHIANAVSHPWFFPVDSFDEGIDLDSILPAIQMVIAWISIMLFRRLGRETPAGARVMLGSS